jgi:hypothetical protein
MDHLAQAYARRQMWATAVLYWQRAAGRAPGHTPYLVRLAKGYAQLGFIQRAIDTLNSANEKVKDSRLRKEIQRELDRLNTLT